MTGNNSQTHMPRPAEGRPPQGAPSRRGRRRGLIAVLSVFVGVLVASLVLAALQPWRKGDDAGSKESATPSASGTTLTVTGPEGKLAEKKGWAAPRDFIPSVSESNKQVIAKIPKLDDSSGRTLGPADAPVTVRVFSDFSCPLCTKLHNDSMDSLIKRAKAGKIRLEWRNFVIFQQYGSDKAARGALAAAQQGKMWDYIAALYKDVKNPQGHTQYTDETVQAIAKNAGLNMTKFDKAYSSQAVTNTLNEESQLAKDIGLTGTPALLVGEAFVPGAYPTKTLMNTVTMQAELAKQKR